MSVIPPALATVASSVRPSRASSGVAAIQARTIVETDAGLIEPTPAAPPDPLAAMVSWAAVRQDSLAPLLANLAALTDAAALPEQIQVTVAQILAVLTPLDASVTGAELRGAAQSSGLFLEQALAALAQQPEAEPTALPPDFKALLVQLMAALPTPQAAHATETRAAPPLAGHTAGQPPAPASLDPEAPPQVIARALSQQAEAALARVQLSQAASVPKPGEPVSWQFEIPVATPGGVGIAQFEISRDGRGAGPGGRGDGGWRAHFSIDADPSGPVHAEVALSGERTRVTLMAPDEATRAALSAGQDELAAALRAEAGGAAVVQVLGGAPARPSAPPGQFVDQQS